MSRAAKVFAHAHRGATQRTLEALEPLLLRSLQDQPSSGDAHAEEA